MCVNRPSKGVCEKFRCSFGGLKVILSWDKRQTLAFQTYQTSTLFQEMTQRTWYQHVSRWDTWPFTPGKNVSSVISNFVSAKIDFFYLRILTLYPIVFTYFLLFDFMSLNLTLYISFEFISSSLTLFIQILSLYITMTLYKWYLTIQSLF